MASPDLDAPTSACAKVFNVLELAEQILLHLPLHDLLCTAPLINKHFHTTITSSLPLQQALFFHPIGRSPLLYTTHSIPHPLYSTPALPATLLQDHWAEPLHPQTRLPILENPLISRLLRSHVHANINKLHQAPVPLPTTPALNLPAAQYEHASWRRMLATQPPMLEAHITRKSDQGTASKATVRRETGVLLQDLDLPVKDEGKMAALSIAGWYLWETCELGDEAREVRRRVIWKR